MNRKQFYTMKYFIIFRIVLNMAATDDIIKLWPADWLICQGHEVNIHEPNLILMTDFVNQRLDGDHTMKKSLTSRFHH